MIGLDVERDWISWHEFVWYLAHRYTFSMIEVQVGERKLKMPCWWLWRWRKGPGIKGCGQPPEIGMGTEPLDGTQMDISLIRPNCGLLTPRTIINLCCLKPQFYGNLLQHHRKLIHMLIYCLTQSKSERNLRNYYLITPCLSPNRPWQGMCPRTFAYATPPLGEPFLLFSVWQDLTIFPKLLSNTLWAFMLSPSPPE